ncbi:hypothetical protein [Nocardia terpenica]|uniref:hypothetical protein n=1 Tax=Nocardia terpenica TaxID=455432 RepID=UPI0012E7B0F6|nr:hypothetical protein [Nocardia terpenica]NQE86710.1 hypothetical protein [Nocardia terpenica]
MEPPEGDKGGHFKFSPEPKTVIEAKSELLPIILSVVAGRVVSLSDFHRKSAELATQWLCSEDKGMTVAGYLFAVLECDGNCRVTYAAFQRMVQELWRKAGRSTGIVTAESNRN